jgi:MFS family permease
MVNYYDRYLIGILVPDLKHDFQLNDTQIGLLSGLAFAIFFSVASLPIASYADRGRRVRVLGVSVAFWSVMAAACGCAAGLWTFLAARFGVGIGEAGAAPTSHAIITETVSPKWRTTALALIGFAGALGTTGAFWGGGYVAQHYGWRMAFFVGAVPGIALSILFLVTVRESRTSLATRSNETSVPMLAAVRTLARRSAFFRCCVAVSISGIAVFGVMAWMPAYLMRQFNLSAAQVGADYSVVFGPAVMLGTLIGGLIGDRLSRRGPRAPFLFLAGALFISGPITMTYFLVPRYHTVLALVFPGTVISTLYLSPLFAAIQALSGPKLRATGAALFLLAWSLIGQGLGPFLVGAMSDIFSSYVGKGGLRIALLIGASTYMVGGMGCLIAAKTAREDIETANRT